MVDFSSDTIRLLNEWAEQYETAGFINNDPVQFPHRYRMKQDIEISGFLTSWLSWGSRTQIIKTINFIDNEIIKGHPYLYIMNKEWIKYKDGDVCLYRTIKYKDFHSVCNLLYQLYYNFSSMEDYVITGSPLVRLQRWFGTVKGIPDEYSNSAAKKLNMFLRWMVRESAVDLGIWKCISRDKLIIPLDTRVHRMALSLGITERKTADMKTAIEITDFFKIIYPEDPCKGDFALFGYGVNNYNYD